MASKDRPNSGVRVKTVAEGGEAVADPGAGGGGVASAFLGSVLQRLDVEPEDWDLPCRRAGTDRDRRCHRPRWQWPWPPLRLLGSQEVFHQWLSWV